MKTYTYNHKEVVHAWKVIDAEGMAIGRVASEVARILRGKHKAIFSPNADCGDHVIILNAEKAVFTGNKALQKEYFKVSTRPGASHNISFENAFAKDPTFPMQHAVNGMLPKGALGDQMKRRLHVYAGAEHKHAAQQPEMIQL
jgi:large subunit ribosomal protein L13